jgi:hypothetical protein
MPLPWCMSTSIKYYDVLQLEAKKSDKSHVTWQGKRQLTWQGCSDKLLPCNWNAIYFNMSSDETLYVGAEIRTRNEVTQGKEQRPASSRDMAPLRQNCHSAFKLLWGTLYWIEIRTINEVTKDNEQWRPTPTDFVTWHGPSSSEMSFCVKLMRIRSVTRDKSQSYRR